MHDHAHHALELPDFFPVLVSLLALAAGPALFELGRRMRLARALHWAVVAGVAGLVLFEVLPHCTASAGWVAVLVASVGLLGPLLAHRSTAGQRRSETSGWSGALILAVAALALHSITDGLALAGLGEHAHEHGHGHDEALGLAVLLHRLPVGAALWALTRERGLGAAFTGFGVVAAGTVLGYGLAEAALPVLETSTAALLQAFCAGVLLHVLSHRPAVARA